MTDQKIRYNHCSTLEKNGIHESIPDSKVYVSFNSIYKSILTNTQMHMRQTCVRAGNFTFKKSGWRTVTIHCSGNKDIDLFILS